jgi:hypothetical protein
LGPLARVSLARVSLARERMQVYPAPGFPKYLGVERSRGWRWLW